MEWWERRYPRDVFVSMELQITAMAANGKLRAPERVYDEIQHIGSPGLRQWATQNRVIFLPHDVPLQTEANNIQTQFPGIIDPNAVHDEADRYVIAVARLDARAVVSYETPASAKRRARGRVYIPDVCVALGIDCFDLLEMMRREGWSF